MDNMDDKDRAQAMLLAEEEIARVRTDAVCVERTLAFVLSSSRYLWFTIIVSTHTLESRKLLKAVINTLI